jgi:hypothetical protein
MRNEYVPYPPKVRRANVTAKEIPARKTGEYRPANPHRVGHYAGLHPEDAPDWTGDDMPRQQSKHIEGYVPEDLEEDVYPCTRTSAIRYRPLETRKLEQPPHLRFHWMVFVGLAMFIMILGWFCLSVLGSWWQMKQDDWHYGIPRTFQIDAVVGHNDSVTNPSHFIAMNLHRRAIVIEIPGGDPSKAQIYLGPTLIGDGQDLTPITLTFQDVNGDGRIDMLIHILDETIVFLNNGTKFVAPR